MGPLLWERKFEIDSLASVLKLQNEFWEKTGDISFINDSYFDAISTIYDVFAEQQIGSVQEDKKFKKGAVPYTF
jgi:meiotically up-regulated gene 157 (Mug157) protein